MEDIIREVAAAKDRLIRLLEEKIKEFQDLTMLSSPNEYPVGEVWDPVYLYNGAAVRWRRNGDEGASPHDWYGKLMHKENRCYKPYNLEELHPLEVAELARSTIKAIKGALKEEAEYFLTAHNELMEAAREVEEASLADIFARALSEVVVETIGGKEGK
jgi:hypothetical protein